VKQLSQRRFVHTIRMHHERKHFIDNVVQAAVTGARHPDASAGAGLRRVRPRGGVEQGQLRYPLRRLPHDFEGDVTAHRVTDQREARRRLGQDPPRDGAHVVVADVIGDRNRP
jgi:hypothetical protein